MKTIPTLPSNDAARFRKLIVMLESKTNSSTQFKIVGPMNDGWMYQLNVDSKSMILLLTGDGSVCPVDF